MVCGRTLTAAVAGVCALVLGPALAVPFQYQGRLEDGGSPANGQYDIRFDAYAAATGGTATGTTTVTGVVATDGVFTTLVDFGTSGLPGGAQWMEIAVRPTGSGGAFTTLTPRQFVAAVPYAAVDLAEPWTRIGSSTLGFGNGLNRVVVNRTGIIRSDEVFGVFANKSGLGGMNVNTPDATGLPYYGYAIGSTQQAYTAFDGPNLRWTLSVGGLDRLSVDASTGAASFTGAVQAGGAVTVNGDITATGNASAASFRYAAPRTNYVSVPGNVFVTADSADGYINAFGNSLGFISGQSGPNAALVAPIQLPHGAVVTKMTAHSIDNTAGELRIQLGRKPHNGVLVELLAEVTTSGASGSIRSATDSTIAFATVDNQTHGYYLRVFSAAWSNDINMSISGVVVEYQVQAAD